MLPASSCCSSRTPSATSVGCHNLGSYQLQPKNDDRVHAMAQAVAGLSPQRLGLSHRPLYIGYGWTEWPWDGLLSECFSIPSQYHSASAPCSLIYLLLKKYNCGNWQHLYVTRFKKVRNDLSQRVRFMSFKVTCSCGKAFSGQISCSVDEQYHHIQLYQMEKSAMVQHRTDRAYGVPLSNTNILALCCIVWATDSVIK
jgi:hypothetical protein